MIVSHIGPIEIHFDEYSKRLPNGLLASPPKFFVMVWSDERLCEANQPITFAALQVLAPQLADQVAERLEPLHGLRLLNEAKAA